MSAPEQAQTLLAEVEVLASLSYDLRTINDQIEAVSHTQADGAVALLSLLPLASRAEPELGFLLDAMNAATEGTRALAKLQGALERILTTLDGRIARLRLTTDDLLASVKVPDA